MKYNLMKVLLLFILSFQCVATPTHSIFITHHAETKHQQVNPPLSQCGRLRAKQLSTLLTHAEIKSVYSTTDLKNMETANPTAQKNNVPVKIFTPKLMGSLAITVMSEAKNVLIVADNNTIKFLIEFISKHELLPQRKNNQELLYQILIVDDQPVLTILKQPLQC